MEEQEVQQPAVEPTARKISLAPLYVALLLVVLGGLSFFKGSPTLSLEDKCEMKNGEWLHGSSVPTCITADGRWLTYDEKAGDFVLSGTDTVASIEPPLGSPVVAHAATPESPDCKGTFDDYPAEGSASAVVAKVNFSSLPAASQFRTVINRGVSRGVNYAGHYIVASWGCPDFDSCTEFAVVDANNGKILSFGNKVGGHPRYLPDSRMLQVTEKDGSATSYLLDETGEQLSACE